MSYDALSEGGSGHVTPGPALARRRTPGEGDRCEGQARGFPTRIRGGNVCCHLGTPCFTTAGPDVCRPEDAMLRPLRALSILIATACAARPGTSQRPAPAGALP